MKNYLLSLLLIISIATLAQTYQNPTFGKLTLKTNTLSTSTAKISTQETDGQINYINALNLPVPTSVINAIKQKADLSTGLIKNGLISASPDDTKFNITAGIGIISNFDNPENPISTIVNFPAFNFITPTYLNTGNITYVAINSTPAVVMQATPFTPEQRRSLIILGAVIHSNLTTINVLNNISAPTNADTNQLHDFMEAVGALNITGNKYTANGSNLQLDKTAGVLFKLGSNFAADWRNPHEIAQAGGTTITFRYRTQNGTESADMTSISPGLYDLNNVLTTVPNNKFTIQTVTVFQTGLTRIQWGQTIYDDLQSAKNALLTRDFVVENNIKENGVTRAYIIVRNSTTSLQNVSDAYISEAQKFGGVASGGVALTLANIVTALGYTPENEANKSDSFSISSSTTYSSTKALVDGLATKQNTLTNPITGTGTTNTIPKWTSANTQGSSQIIDNGTDVIVGGGVTGGKLTVLGGAGNNSAVYIRKTDQQAGRYGLTIEGGSFNEAWLNFKAPLTIFRADGGIIYDAGVGNSISFRKFGAGGNTPMTISAGDRILVKTTSDNGIDALQVNGTATASPATLSSQLTTFGQVFTSPTFTGVPSVPTATAGTNTTQIASTAFVFANTSGGLLEFNTTDRTVWNNGKNNIDGNLTFGEEAVRLATGNSNSVFGNYSARAMTTANDNTILGNSSMRGLTTGSGNLSAGNSSGWYIADSLTLNTNSSNSVFLGASSFPLADNQTNQIVIGHTAIGKGSNTVTLGNDGITDTYLKGVVNQSKSYTVATLPVGKLGDFTWVTDATAPTYLGVLIGGGSVKCPVFYNGTNWVSH